MMLRLLPAAGLLWFAVQTFAAAAADCPAPAKGAEGGRAALTVFGSFISQAQAPRSPMSADLDGDGKADDVYALALRAQGRDDCVAHGTTFVNPWSGKPRNPRAAIAAVGVRLASGARYVFHDNEFFASPIWKQRALPVAIVKRGSKEHREFAHQAAGLRHDIIVLGTEAGIDIALYWDGKRFQLLQPREIP